MVTLSKAQATIAYECILELYEINEGAWKHLEEEEQGLALSEQHKLMEVLEELERQLDITTI